MITGFLSRAPQAQIQTARNPGGFNHIKIGLARRIGLAGAGGKARFGLDAP
jgi:hypothetical protein